MRLDRANVPKEQTWDLTDLFSSTDVWEKELEKVQTDVNEVVAFKGRLGENAKTLLAALEAFEDFYVRLGRVATYAFLQLSVVT